MPPEDQPFGLGAGLEGWLERAAPVRCAWIFTGERKQCELAAVDPSSATYLGRFCTHHWMCMAYLIDGKTLTATTEDP